MSFNPLSGIVGAVTINAATFALGKWTFDMECGIPNVNNFTSAYQQIVPGVTKGTLHISGPYDGGNMPLVVGTSYAFVLKASASISLTVTAIVNKITPSQDIDDAARVDIEASSNGSFTAAIT